ncbi:RusA family crossover junction endodeoxyribonuclease [Listeria grandensis]|uniref:RusA family crossover junction endodeoxyribonuclease n=1 Tax=Listeria grandensis TaxID=1494963 RepID=A0A7X0Y1G7_9LIST|nr:RusA family crossover junction endodeoxyribonuclease [Listeria grandensis]MBC1935211.1 RusA family crossover junction endodeoxyribonuclease [Listeria grandensis]
MSKRKLEFDIPLEPVAQGRPRFATRGKFTTAYDPPKSKKYKDTIKQMIKSTTPPKMLEGPLFVELTFYRNIPKSFSKKERAAALAGTMLPTQKPDVDNYAKAILDAISGYFFHDDNQISDLVCRKRYSDNPRTHVVLREKQVSKPEQIALEI